MTTCSQKLYYFEDVVKLILYTVSRASVFGKMKMDPAKRAQTQNAGVTINVPVVYMVRYKVVLRGDYP
jgi:hypothetical protein